MQCLSHKLSILIYCVIFNGFLKAPRGKVELLQIILLYLEMLTSTPKVRQAILLIQAYTSLLTEERLKRQEDKHVIQ